MTTRRIAVMTLLAATSAAGAGAAIWILAHPLTLLRLFG